MLITLAVIAIVALVGFAVNFVRHKKIHRRGVETDAVVSCVRETEKENAEGGRTADYECFVMYRNEAGETTEAKLGNPTRMLREGMQVRVKYLPEKPKYVLMVEP